jgi:hypothetical protein
MKHITPTLNEHSWPRSAVPSVECRKRDLVIRIADWSRDQYEPAIDVEVYIGGVYDWNESKTCTFHEYGSKAAAKAAAVEFAAQQTKKLL